MPNGTIQKRERADGSTAYRIRFDVPYTENGRDRISETFDDRDQAENRLDQLNYKYGVQGHTKPSEQPFKEHFKHWLDTKQKDVKETTYELYKSHLRNHITGTRVGDRPLSEVTRNLIEDHINDLSNGNYDHVKDEGLSASYVQDHQTLIQKSLDWAIERGKINTNPISNMSLTYDKTETEVDVLNESQLGEFLHLVQEEEPLLYPLFLTAVNTGMRKSEVCGLQWQDVDLKSGTIRIRKQLNKSPYCGLQFMSVKTKSSKRSINIPQMLVDELRKQKQRQKKWKQKAGTKVWHSHNVADGVNLKRNQFVFTDKSGKPIRPDRAYACFKRLIDKAGFPDLTFHHLRHTHASILLKQGHSPKTIQIRLGHSDIETTMNFYGHLMKGMDQQAADAFGSSIQNALKEN